MVDAAGERRALADYSRALADYMNARRAVILESWRGAINRDPALSAGDSLPRVQLLDHIPDI